MLHEKITSQGVKRTVALMIADDLKEELDVFRYTVETEIDESMVYAVVRVIDDRPCCIITSTVMRHVMNVAEIYCMKYENVSYCLTTVEKRGRSIPAIEINICIY